MILLSQISLLQFSRILVNDTSIQKVARWKLFLPSYCLTTHSPYLQALFVLPPTFLSNASTFLTSELSPASCEPPSPHLVYGSTFLTSLRISCLPSPTIFHNATLLDFHPLRLSTTFRLKSQLLPGVCKPCGTRACKTPKLYMIVPSTAHFNCTNLPLCPRKQPLSYHISFALEFCISVFFTLQVLSSIAPPCSTFLCHTL